MSTHKTTLGDAELETFLHGRLGVGREAAIPVLDGENSQAFFVVTPEGERVIRFNTHIKWGFLKDQYAAKHFSSEAAPVPKIREVGTIRPRLYFAITDRVPGKPISQHTDAEVQSLVPRIISALDAINTIPLSGEGYGRWKNGKARRSSWQETIIKSAKLDIDKEQRRVTDAEFYDASVHASLRERLLAVLAICPEERKLVHGDFGSNNMLSDGQNITGVIDWEHSMYGDPLYDVAWIDFWDQRHRYKQAFKEHYTAQSTLPERYDERIHCYQLWICLNAARFAAYSRQARNYQFIKEMAQNL